MSSYWAGNSATALMLTEEDAILLLKNYFNHPDNKSDDKEMFAKLFDQNIQDVCEDEDYDSTIWDTEFPAVDSKHLPFELYHLDYDTHDGMLFTPFKPNFGKRRSDKGWKDYAWRDSGSFVIFVNHEYGMPWSIEKPPYKNYEELEQEFRNKIEQFVPEDFNWAERIGCLCYASYA